MLGDTKFCRVNCWCEKDVAAECGMLTGLLTDGLMEI